MVTMTEKVEGIVLMPEPSRESLDEHQLVDYRDHRQKFVKWALNVGKDPKHADGYAHLTVRQRAYRLDTRFVIVIRSAGVSYAESDSRNDSLLQ